MSLSWMTPRARLPSTTADQLDLTYEWYFAPTGSVTAAIFYKKFNDYIQYGSYTQDFTNNGVTRTVTLRAPITGDGASIRAAGARGVGCPSAGGACPRR